MDELQAGAAMTLLDYLLSAAVTTPPRRLVELCRQAAREIERLKKKLEERK